ncbi:hypothetical protein ONZ51_g4999 [Trametes cubensis]|uniref:DUF4219 domain-containing protein n=1 Tax=Trametes cubensis TaxID=1111947 RepID=A0AAD7TX92_9APHY|nr:hypothetical protein ONZ51_g4999 [Trametes cubensis]
MSLAEAPMLLSVRYTLILLPTRAPALESAPSRLVRLSTRLLISSRSRLASRILPTSPCDLTVTLSTTAHNLREVMSPAMSAFETSAASAGASSSDLRFTKLNGENYNDWAINMKATLQSKLLWLLVEGSEPCPAKPEDSPPTDPEKLKEWKAAQKEYMEWTLRDHAAQGTMLVAADRSAQAHVSTCTTAKAMWDLLN